MGYAGTGVILICSCAAARHTHGTRPTKRHLGLACSPFLIVERDGLADGKLDAARCVRAINEHVLSRTPNPWLAFRREFRILTALRTLLGRR